MNIPAPVTDPWHRRMCLDALGIAVSQRRTTHMHRDTPLIAWRPVGPRTPDTPDVTDWRDAAAIRIGL